MVCMGNGVKNRYAMVHHRTNGQWELWSLIRYDELRDMGYFVPMRKEVY